MYARFAFGRAAPIYELLTEHEAWRADARALAALVGGPRVLDLGIGPGAGVVEAARIDRGRRPVGVDLSAQMLRRARKRARAAGVPLEVVRADALALPVRDAVFDGATAHSFLYLLPDPARAVREIARVLRPGAPLAVLEPRAAGADLRAALRTGARHALAMVMWRGMSGLHRRFDEASLAALLAEAGLAGVRAWPVMSGYGVMATASKAGAVDGRARVP